jgi:hypothetical protein
MGRVDGVMTTTAYELPVRSVDAVQVSPVSTAFANFSSAQDFAAAAFFRVREPQWNGPADVCGRVVGGVGWYLWITLGGCPAITLIGATSTLTVTGLAVVTHGDLCGVGVSFNATTGIVTLVDAVGSYAASTAAIGQWRADDVGRFAIAGSGSGLGGFAGQVARVYLWRGGRPTAAELATTITGTTLPAGLALLTSW